MKKATLQDVRDILKVIRTAHQTTLDTKELTEERRLNHKNTVSTLSSVLHIIENKEIFNVIKNAYQEELDDLKKYEGRKWKWTLIKSEIKL